MSAQISSSDQSYSSNYWLKLLHLASPAAAPRSTLSSIFQIHSVIRVSEIFFLTQIEGPRTEVLCWTRHSLKPIGVFHLWFRGYRPINTIQLKWKEKTLLIVWKIGQNDLIQQEILVCSCVSLSSINLYYVSYSINKYICNILYFVFPFLLFFFTFQPTENITDTTCRQLFRNSYFTFRWLDSVSWRSSCDGTEPGESTVTSFDYPVVITALLLHKYSVVSTLLLQGYPAAINAQ